MPDRKTIFMFSGQGSHYFQMGRALYEEPSTFRDWMLRMDLIVRELSGYSVIHELYLQGHTKSETFDRTLLTHPAIFMVEYALAQELIEAGIRPDLTLGASLGSFAAAAVAGCIEMEEALTMVLRQAMTLEACCQPGGMVAVLAQMTLYDAFEMHSNCEVAATNFSSHFAVAAKQKQLEQVEAFLRQSGTAFQRLPVSFAFHSRWIDEARVPFQAHLRSLPYKSADIPLVCCAQSAIITELSSDYFWSVARQPIRFQQTLASLEDHGSYRYIDVGPAGTLATFVKYALPSTSRSSIQAILTPFGGDLENIAAIGARSVRGLRSKGNDA